METVRLQQSERLGDSRLRGHLALLWAGGWTGGCRKPVRAPSPTCHSPAACQGRVGDGERRAEEQTLE